MPLDLDFAPAPRWRQATLAALGCTLAASGWLLWERQELLAQRVALHAQRVARDNAFVRPGAPVPRPHAAGEAKELQESIAALQRPWDAMFSALRDALQDDIEIVEVQQDGAPLRWRVAGRADSVSAFLAFVQRLQSDAAWEFVEPVSQSNHPQRTEPGVRPVAFRVVAQWRLR